MPFANARKRAFSVLWDNDADQTLWFITLSFASMTVLLVVLTYAESSLTREEHGLNAIVARVWRSLRHRLLRLRAELAHSLGSTEPVSDLLPGHR